MKRLAILTLTLIHLAPGAPSRADPVDDLQSRAEEAYREGIAKRGSDLLARPHFEVAARTYGLLSKERGESAAFRRMEGNAWLLSGDLPKAIASYRRGLVLSPDDPMLRRGLEYARSRVTFSQPDDRDALTPRTEEYGLLASFLRRWGLVALTLASVVGWLTLARWIVTRRPRWIATSAFALALTAALGAGWLLERDHRREQNAAPFAVTARSNMLRRGDGPSFLPRRESPLPAGVEVTIRRERNGWCQVQLADGTLGWLPAADLLR